ncbi:MAG: Nif3-like dinuclear metal center hexameric protein, partial [Firmicutes bacterium]|nr:Nif3-like dinuclear metal center hexameric protein [Bacillota bacterium]
PDKLISRVAVCTGDGTEYWEAAYNAGADLFVTGEFKHHEASYCSESGMCYISAGHAGTEWIFVPCMEKQFGLLTMGQIEIYKTESHQEPFLRRI